MIHYEPKMTSKECWAIYGGRRCRAFRRVVLDRAGWRGTRCRPGCLGVPCAPDSRQWRHVRSLLRTLCRDCRAGETRCPAGRDGARAAGLVGAAERRTGPVGGTATRLPVADAGPGRCIGGGVGAVLRASRTAARFADRLAPSSSRSVNMWSGREVWREQTQWQTSF